MSSLQIPARTVLGGFGLAVLAVSLLWSGVAPGAPTANAADGTTHWARTTVSVRDETGYPDYRRAITVAAARWNAADANVQLAVTGGRGAGCDNPQPGEIPVCRHTFSGSQAGEARVWASGDHIVRASVLIDARPRPFEQLVAIACHELGHALGRPHRQEASSCLTANVGSSAPDDRDRAELRAAHAHVPHPEPAPSPAPSAGTGENTSGGCHGSSVLRLGSTCLGTLLPRAHHH